VYWLGWIGLGRKITTFCGFGWVKLRLIVQTAGAKGRILVDAAYCYRPSSVVCRSVCWSICRSVCKSGRAIEMPFELRTWVDLENHVLDGAPREGAILLKEGRPIVKYRDILRSSVQTRLNRSPCRLDRGLGLAQEIMC